MYVGMIETRSLKILLKSFHENYSDLFKKTTWYFIYSKYWIPIITGAIYWKCCEAAVALRLTKSIYLQQDIKVSEEEIPKTLIVFWGSAIKT